MTEFGRHRAGRQSLYVRLLGLRHVRPGSLMCFILFEGSVLLAVLLSMAELVSWWSVLVLPLVIATMVKINDAVAGVLAGGAHGGKAAVADSEPVNVRVARRSDARRFD